MKYAERLRPFSHEKGERFLIPHTHLQARIFPTRLELVDWEHPTWQAWILFKWSGPVQQFTVQLDLEREVIYVFGKAKEGYFQYQIGVGEEGLTLELKRGSAVKLTSSLWEERILNKGESILLRAGKRRESSKERLFLGCNKAQDVTGISRRQELAELFPFWLRVAALTPCATAPERREGNYRLLAEGKTPFLDFYLAAFSGFFVPRLIDTEYQGILVNEGGVDLSLPPLPLLHESAAAIRSLFVKEEGGSTALLPALPVALHCGKVVGIESPRGERIDFEWVKKRLRTVEIVSKEGGEVRLILPKGISSCRLKSKRVNLKRIEVQKGGVLEFPLESGTRGILDRFEG
jgi:hypothetical protein